MAVMSKILPASCSKRTTLQSGLCGFPHYGQALAPGFFVCQRVIKPRRKGACLEDDQLCVRSMLADDLSQCFRITRAFASPDPLPILPDRNRRIFQRNIEPDILVHGCLPFDAGPSSDREPVFYLTGRNHPCQILLRHCLRGRRQRLPHVQGETSTFVEVLREWMKCDRRSAYVLPACSHTIARTIGDLLPWRPAATAFSSRHNNHRYLPCANIGASKSWVLAWTLLGRLHVRFAISHEYFGVGRVKRTNNQRLCR